MADPVENDLDDAGTDLEPVEGSEPQTDPAAATEAKARTMGWDPAKGALTAEEFVKRGEEIGGFVKKHNAKLERELGEARKEVAELKTTMAEAKEFFSKTEKRAYEQAKRELEARLDAAVEAGDTAAARAITVEAGELAAEMVPAPKGKPSDPITSARDAWISDNPWFDSDPDLRAFALGIGEQIKDSIEPLKQFAEIERRVKAAFPAKFTNARREAPATVEGAPQGRRTATKGWADLPPEAKATADRFIKQGFVKDRAAYVAKYDFGA